jgi:rRNA biogenesis protein RRP5
MRKNKDISGDPTYWLNYATFLMTTLARPDDARALLARATQVLPTHTHSQTISRFGALEYSSPQGDIERGRTIFEGLIDAHKNGHDLWDQYLAQEISLVNNGKEGGDVESVRKLFERMGKAKMKPKRAKYVFKKWLGWERDVAKDGKGGDKHLAKVKALAEEWVEKNGGKGLDV